MIIDADVASIAKHFGVDPALIQAVVQAEGNILRAVQSSIPTVTTRQQAIEITCRSAVHAMSDFVKAEHAPDYVKAWGERWAPVGVSNDPNHLNKNWSANVLKLWTTR
jgi:hypothetical protein